jgi:hypothetical protein
VLTCSSAGDGIAQTAVQLQYNDRLCCCVDCTDCTAVGGWKNCTKLMAVATEFALKWWYSGTVWCAVQR